MIQKEYILGFIIIVLIGICAYLYVQNKSQTITNCLDTEKSIEKRIEKGTEKGTENNMTCDLNSCRIVSKNENENENENENNTIPEEVLEDRDQESENSENSSEIELDLIEQEDEESVEDDPIYIEKYEKDTEKYEKDTEKYEKNIEDIVLSPSIKI